MTHLLLLCHEGELSYVRCDLREALSGHPEVQIVGQGSTEKMYMGYLLLSCDGELPAELFEELRANPDVYLYAVHDPNVWQDEEDGAGEATGDEETEAASQSEHLAT
jgi:hypothetical protein